MGLTVKMGEKPKINVKTGVTVQIPATLQEKTVTPTKEQQTIKADEGFDALKSVTVEGYEVKLQEKTATPSTAEQVIKADTDFDGLGKVTVERIPQEYTDEVYKDGYDVGYEKGYVVGNDEATPYKVKNLTITGDYKDHPTYINASIDSNGYLTIIAVGTSGNSYAKIQFARKGYPTKNHVASTNQSYEERATVTASALVLKNYKKDVNVTLDFSELNDTYYCIRCYVTVEEA